MIITIFDKYIIFTRYTISGPEISPRQTGDIKKFTKKSEEMFFFRKFIIHLQSRIRTIPGKIKDTMLTHKSFNGFYFYFYFFTEVDRAAFV